MIVENVSEYYEQLKLLKMMTLKVGCIHEAQTLQLKCYIGMIDNIKDYKININTETHTVQYDCQVPNFKLSSINKKILASINEWVRNLLWNDTKVVYIINNKKVRFNG